MANYEDLKAAVAQVIKTNGNNEITGQLLQDTLMSIIGNLGDNSGFAGVATPTTVPGSPDSNQFYLIGTPGTYPNFGGLVVDDAIYVVNNRSGSWVPTLLINLSKFAEQAIVDQNKADLITGLYGTEFSVSGFYVHKTHGGLNAGAFKCTDFIPIDPTKPIEVRGRDGATASILNFYSETKVFIAPYSETSLGADEQTINIAPENIPPTAAFVRASADIDSDTCYVKVLSNTLLSLSNTLLSLGDGISSLEAQMLDKADIEDVFFTDDKKTNTVVSEIFIEGEKRPGNYRLNLIRNGAIVGGVPTWGLTITVGSHTISSLTTTTKPKAGVVLIPKAAGGEDSYVNINFDELEDGELYNPVALVLDKAWDLTKSPLIKTYLETRDYLNAVGQSVTELDKEINFVQSDFIQGYLSNGLHNFSETTITTANYLKVVPGDLLRFFNIPRADESYFRVRIIEFNSESEAGFVKQTPETTFQELSTLRVQSPFIKISLQRYDGAVLPISPAEFIPGEFSVERDFVLWKAPDFTKEDFSKNINDIFPDLENLEEYPEMVPALFQQGSMTRGEFTASTNAITSDFLKVVPGSLLYFRYLQRVDESYFNLRFNEFDADLNYTVSNPETSWSTLPANYRVSELTNYVKITILLRDVNGVNSPFAPADLQPNEFIVRREVTVWGGDFLSRLETAKAGIEQEIEDLRENVGGATVGKIRVAPGGIRQIGRAVDDYTSYKLLKGKPHYIETSGSKGKRNYKGRKFLGLQFADFFDDDANFTIPLLNKYDFTASFVVQECPKDDNFLDGFPGRATGNSSLMQLIFSSGSNLEDHTPWHWTLSHELPFADGYNFPSNNEMRQAVNLNRNVFGYDIDTPVSDKVASGYLLHGNEYENKNWGDLTEQDCDYIRKTLSWFRIPRLQVSGSVVETGGTRVLECLDFLSNRYLGTTGYGRVPNGGIENPVLDQYGYPTYTDVVNWDVDGRVAGGIFQGSLTTQNHEIYERILDICKLWAGEVYGQPIDYASWGRAGGIANVFYYLDFETNLIYLDSAKTLLPWIHSKLPSSIMNYERSVYEIFKQYDYKRSGFLNGSGRRTGTGVANTQFSRTLSLNGNVSKKLHNLDGGYTSTFRMYGFGIEGITQAEWEANEDNENVFAWRYDADKAAGYAYGAYIGLNNIANFTAWGLIPMHTEDTSGSNIYRKATHTLLEEMRLRFCKEAGIEVVSLKEAFEIAQKEMYLINYFPNFEMERNIQKIVNSTINPQLLPDGWIGDGEVVVDATYGDAVSMINGNRNYIRQYQLSYGTFDLNFKAIGVGTLNIYRLQNKDVFHDGVTESAFNPKAPYLTIEIDNADWGDVAGLIEIPNNPTEAVDPNYMQMDGNHNQICGLQFTFVANGNLMITDFYLGKTI